MRKELLEFNLFIHGLAATAIRIAIVYKHSDIRATRTTPSTIFKLNGDYRLRQDLIFQPDYRAIALRSLCEYIVIDASQTAPRTKSKN
jgi:hypothetical protein